MKKSKKFWKQFDFKGYRTQFPVGIRQDMIAFTLTGDDGTYANWLIVEVNEVPYAAIPIVNKEGLGKMIRVLQEMYEEAFNDE